MEIIESNWPVKTESFSNTYYFYQVNYFIDINENLNLFYMHEHIIEFIIAWFLVMELC